jgi:hypothetical protein
LRISKEISELRMTFNGGAAAIACAVPIHLAEEDMILRQPRVIYKERREYEPPEGKFAVDDARTLRTR